MQCVTLCVTPQVCQYVTVPPNFYDTVANDFVAGMLR